MSQQDGISYTGVHRLEGPDTFEDWLRTIELYARHVGCHRTLFGHFAEPARRHVPPNTAPGHVAYDTIRPPGQRAGDSPPGPGQCAYVLDAGGYNNVASISDVDATRWQTWALMEAKAQALVLGTVSPAIETQLSPLWSANDMLAYIRQTYGAITPQTRAAARTDLESLRLPEHATYYEMFSHMSEFLRLNARANKVGAAYQDWELSHRFVQSLAPPVTTDVYVLWTLLPADQQTWPKLQEVYNRIMDARKFNPQTVNALRQPIAHPPPQANQPLQPARRVQAKNDYTPGATCAHCGRTNHTLEQCRQRLAGKPPRQQYAKPKEQGTTATAGTSAHVDTPPAAADTTWPASIPLWEEDVAHVTFDIPTTVAEPAQDTVALISDHDGQTPFLLDSGSSANLVHDRSLLTNQRTVPPVTFNHAGKTGSLTSTVIGTLLVVVPGGHALIPDVYYVPTARLHLLSVLRVRRAGWYTNLVSDCFSGHGAAFPVRDTRMLAVAHLPIHTPHPRPDVLAITDDVLAVSDKEDNLLLAEHRRMGHLGAGKLMALARLGKLRYPADTLKQFSLDLAACSACGFLATSARHPRAGISPRGSSDGEMVHADLTGITTPGVDGSRYALVLVADHTRVRAIFPLARKLANDVLPLIQRFITRVETQTGVVVKTIRTDNGGEFVNTQAQCWYASRGMNHQTSPSYSAEHNGVAERNIGTIKRMAASMLAATPLGPSYWPFAMAQAVAILNMTTESHIAGTTAWQAITGRVADTKSLLVFGQPVLAHVPLPNRAPKSQFISARTRLARYLGVHHTSTGVIVRYEDNGEFGRTADFIPAPTIATSQPIHPTGKTIGQLASSQIALADTSLPPTQNPVIRTAVPASAAPFLLTTCEASTTTGPPPQPPSAPNGASTTPLDTPAPPHASPAPPIQATSLPTAPPSSNAHHSATTATTATTDRPRRVTRPPDRYGHHSMHLDDSSPRLSCLLSEMLLVLSLEPEEGDPSSVKDALTGPNARHWHDAMTSELQALAAKGTWSEVSSIPAPHKAIGCKWVFRTKRDPDGTVTKHKARLVAQGFTQQPGRDFESTYAPVGRFSSLRLILDLAARNDLEIHVADVQLAYLNGNLDRDLYLRLPAGYAARRSDTTALKLHKTLYGLKQAGHEWWRVLSAALANLGFTRLKSDWGLYRLGPQDKPHLIVLVYVDDLVLIAKDTTIILQTIAKLHDQWPVTHLGEIHQLLGIKVHRDRAKKTIKLSLPRYIDSLLTRFPADASSSPTSPLPLNHAVSSADLSETPAPLNKFQEISGCIGFIAHMVRPDVEFAANWLGRFNHSATNDHWNLALRVIAYLAGTKDVGVQLGGPSPKATLSLHSDASWNPAHSKGRSTSGYVATISGAAISWSSRRQDTPASSTMVSEYVAAAEATHEALWLRSLLHELGQTQHHATPILIDNTSAIKLGQNPFAHSKSKHVELRYHIVREQVEQQTVRLVSIPGSQQLADCLTKPLPGPAMAAARSRLNLVH